jgi:formiminotetrahydrofolate cyclodeaminase
MHFAARRSERSMHLASQSLSEFLDLLASRTPSPGGGAVAPIAAGLAAAVAAMVVNYSTGKEKFADHEALYRDTLERLEALRREAVELAAEDARAYERLNQLQKGRGAGRSEDREWAHAVAHAIEVPRFAVRMGGEILSICERLCGRSNRMLRSDLAIAAVMAEAAVRVAAWNVSINLALLEDKTRREALDRETAEAVATATGKARLIEAACA